LTKTNRGCTPVGIILGSIFGKNYQQKKKR